MTPRLALFIFAALYLACGLIVSTAMAYAVPATSLAGRAYLAATWPCWIRGSPCAATLEPPAWAFQFRDAPR